MEVDPDQGDRLATERSHSSVDTAVRVEMLWNSRLQRRLEQWYKRVLAGVASHDAAAKKKKRLFKVLGITSSLMVLVLGIMTPFFNHPLTYAVLLSIAACLGAVNTSMDYGGLTQRHLTAASRFAKLALELEYTIDQPKSDRAAADVTMTSFRFQISEIEESSPDIG
jgi:hypothetical protein